MTTDTPYRWSPEVERQFLSLVEVGCTPAIIAEQIGCSERMARRLLLRWKSGLPLNNERPRATVPALPRRKPGRPGSAWETNIMRASPEYREARRVKALDRIAEGDSVDRVSSCLHVPISVVREWVRAAVEAGDLNEPPPPPPPVWDWPAVTMRVADWPADARFEDESRACRPEPPWRPVATISDRVSYVSNATAWCAA